MSGAAVQLGLFGDDSPKAHRSRSSYPHAPGFKTGGTSKAAADRIAPTVDRLRDAVLAEIERRPGTADEVAERIGRNTLAVRPRVSELRRLGKIAATDERRRNRSKCSATVWRVGP